jgi:Fur family peroxide stress response transcriptional regulator
MVAELRAAGCRITLQRRTVVRAFADRHDHPSVRQVAAELRQSSTPVSLATIYNTTGKLVKLGLLAEIEFESDDNRYDTNTQPHLNLVCTECGSITDIDHELPVSPRDIRRQVGFETTGWRLEYRGVCRRCRAVGKTTARGGRKETT